MFRPALLLLLGACAGEPDAPSEDVYVGDTDLPDTDLPHDSGGTEGDSGIDCGPWLQPDGAGGCEDANECLEDNGGCGDPDEWDCENLEAQAPACHYNWTADWRILTADVETVVNGGSLPSRAVVWGERSFPVLWTEGGAVFVAAARVGEGHVLHLGHESQVGSALTGSGDAATLVRNAIAWMAPGGSPRIGLSSGMSATRSWLEGEGYSVVTAGPDDLADIDLWFTTTYDDHTADQDAAIRAWITDGGGVIAGGHAWWWAYSTGDDDPYHNHPGNQWLGVAGLTLSGDSVGDASSVAVEDPPSRMLHAGRALRAAGEHVAGDPLPDEDAVMAAQSAGFAASVLPVDSEWFLEARALLASMPPVLPSATDPVEPATEPIDALMVRIGSALAQRLPIDELTEHPASSDFPGIVDREAPRVTVTVGVNATYAGRDGRYSYSGAGAAIWRSTGLYVPPGEIVTVTLPPEAVGSGVDLLVGSHSDSLWGTESWSRVPQLTRSFDVDSSTVELASAFGGLLYLRVPAGLALGELELTVAGAVESPRFILGQNTVEDWQSTLRDRPAPWGELESEGLVLTLPSSLLRGLDDPEALMVFWQQVMDAQATLGALAPPRVRAERIVTDRQISAGWMHSGYPIMAHLESASEFADLDLLQAQGSWGAFHELGHNHQWRDWLLPGTTEATCNLWSVYTMEEVVGIDRADGHPAMTDVERQARIDAYIAGGRNFTADWSVWTALETFLQIQEAFGWQPLIDVQAQYLADPSAGGPSTDAERIDLWVQRCSVAVGRDLTAFYDAWGFPIGSATRAAVSGLPAWTDHPMP